MKISGSLNQPDDNSVAAALKNAALDAHHFGPDGEDGEEPLFNERKVECELMASLTKTGEAVDKVVS